MSRFPKPCLDCGKLTTGGNRCDYHQNLVEQLHNIKRAEVKKNTGQYSGAYRKRAALVRATALVCWICGEGAKHDDPWQADHVNPAEHGDQAELLAAHASCNRKRGNKV
jgi:hypothetical protein